jgi:hypothetical protein
MAVKRNPAAAWDTGPWYVTTVEVEGESARLHVRKGMLDEVPDIVSRTVLAKASPPVPLADGESMEGFVLVAPKLSTSGQYVRVRPARPEDRRV